MFLPKFDYHEPWFNPGRFRGGLMFDRTISQAEFGDIPDETFPVVIQSPHFQG
jgi:hypothetical protein